MQCHVNPTDFLFSSMLFISVSKQIQGNPEFYVSVNEIVKFLSESGLSAEVDCARGFCESHC